MKENHDKLTLQETERLCHLYMDCKLNVLEETELQYVLGKLPYSSPCIDEVRMIMGVSVPKATTQSSKKRFGWPSRRMWIGGAASITILFAVGISIFNPQGVANNKSSGVYIAYANGKQLNSERSEQQVRSDIAEAEEFLNHIAQMEAEEQERVENFLKQIEQ